MISVVHVARLISQVAQQLRVVQIFHLHRSHALVIPEAFLVKPLVVTISSGAHFTLKIVGAGAAEHSGQLFTSGSVKLVNIDPVMVLDQDDNEVFGDNAHDVACGVHHGEARETGLQKFLQVGDRNDAFNSNCVR